MNKFKIGIFLNVDRHSGGMYQACISMVSTIYSLYSENKKYDFVIYTKAANHEFKDKFNADNWEVAFLPEAQKKTFKDKLREKINHGPLRDFMRWFNNITTPIDINSRTINPSLDKFLKQYSPDLMFFPNCDPQAYRQKTPYMTFIPDLQHLIQPEFPEVGDKYVFPRREKHIRNLVKHSTLLITDSEAGKEDVLYYYHKYLPANTLVEVLPYRLSNNLSPDLSDDAIREVAKKLKLPDRYFFYPAQFWEHKNHRRIIESIILLNRRYHLNAKIVFCGSTIGKYRSECIKKLKSMVSRYKLEDKVLFFDYLSDTEVSALYKQAVALVMPTFFGPANIPIIEAWAMDCPVIYSDIRGLKEQAGDAALLVDPRSVPSIADAMKKLWEDDSVRQQLIANGRKRLDFYSEENYNINLTRIINNAVKQITDERISTE